MDLRNLLSVTKVSCLGIAIEMVRSDAPPMTWVALAGDCEHWGQSLVTGDDETAPHTLKIKYPLMTVPTDHNWHENR